MMFLEKFDMHLVVLVMFNCYLIISGQYLEIVFLLHGPARPKTVSQKRLCWRGCQCRYMPTNQRFARNSKVTFVKWGQTRVPRQDSSRSNETTLMWLAEITIAMFSTNHAFLQHSWYLISQTTRTTKLIVGLFARKQIKATRELLQE